MIAEEIRHQRDGFRSLNLHHRNIRIPDRDIHPGMDRDAARPKLQIAVGGGEPVPIPVDADDDGVAEDAAIRCRDQRVLTLSDRAGFHVAGREILNEARCVRSGDLNLAFAHDRPDRHVPGDMPELFDRIGEGTRDIGSVIDGEVSAAVAPSGLKEGTFSDARLKSQLGARVLDQTRQRPSPFPPRVWIIFAQTLSPRDCQRFLFGSYLRLWYINAI